MLANALVMAPLRSGEGGARARATEENAGRGQRLRRLLRTPLRLVALVVLLGATRSSLADQYHVPTGSMWPTIEPGDRIVVAKAAYGLRLPFSGFRLFDGDGPRLGDVVLFDDPRGGAIPLVKRVVALEGQTVAMRGGVLTIDGQPQRMEVLGDGRIVEHLGAVEHEAGGRDFEDYGPVVVPKGHMFMMGDNRPASLDSRMMGTVPRSLLLGRVLGVAFRGEGIEWERVFRWIR